MFSRDETADTSDTYYLESVFLPPAFLTVRFGPPARADGHKVSGRYVFGDSHRNVFTLYDWKSTSLYLGGGGEVPTPAEFWADSEPHEFSIGGRGEENDDGLNLPATAFREWLLEQYRGYTSSMVN